ncbi:helix-turn-helix domain-containing protein [Leptospira yasudae]|uniref:Helix-turn-helix domain-containing protein n=2 Tax=Leptospira yasudae TaxID=2202201 RepID=A0A6N4QGT2_9LEPT|nr:helix-turn-helix domain-containing protein [Leptospira yasudae]TGL83158.1 helix-turn-helix domain-containing protein [Leptospira yasudae]TGL85611.1 helix-turn-helix domain-containing protein [Leptospira yasudae]
MEVELSCFHDSILLRFQSEVVLTDTDGLSPRPKDQKNLDSRRESSPNTCMYSFLAFGAGLAFLLSLSGWITSIRDENESPIERTNASTTNKRFRLTISFLQKQVVSCLFFSIGVVQLHIFFELSDRLIRFAWIAETHIPFIFAIGPLTYLYFRNLSGESIGRFSPIHLFPCVVSVATMFPFYLRDFVSKQSFLKIENPKDPYHNIVLILLILGTIQNFLYPIVLFRKIWNWRSGANSERKTAFTPFLLLFAGTLFVLILFVIAQSLFMPLFLVASSGVTLLLCIVFITGHARIPWVEQFKKESREARYAESRIRGLNVDAVLLRLNDLMRNEKYYADEDLTLRKLSEALGIHTHQLSEILNSKIKKSFREFVADFRLEEAARILLEEPQRSVLSAAYASGFNSKSAFHKLFQEKFGCTPTEFRTKPKLPK